MIKIFIADENALRIIGTKFNICNCARLRVYKVQPVSLADLIALTKRGQDKANKENGTVLKSGS
ncbi:MAG: hypothetical protein ABI402_13570 [Ferruginibacter sp.]